MDTSRLLAALGLHIGVVACGIVGASQEANAEEPTPVPVARRGSPEHKRILIQQERVRKGLARVHNLSGDPMPIANPPRTQVPDSMGTTIVPHAKATGEMLQFQKDFAAALAAQDTRPAERRQHFAWLENTEAFKKQLVHPVGWYGAVEDVQGLPTGSALVKIRISPRLHSNTFKTAQLDYVTETYEFFRGKVRLVDSDANIPKPQAQVYPSIR